MVIVEYNTLFDDDATVSVPHDARFDRQRDGYPNIYYGASLAAFDHMLAANGYALAACMTAGNNAFFVRTDRLGEVPSRAVTEAFRPRRFVEHRASVGTLSGIPDRRMQLHDIRDLPLVDVTNQRSPTVAELLAE